MRWRQVGRVTLRHVLDLARDRRTILTLLTVPILTVILMAVASDQIFGSIGGAANIRVQIAVSGTEHGREFVRELEDFANFDVVETDDARAAVRDGVGQVGLEVPRNFDRRIERGKQAGLHVIQSRPSVRTSIAEAALQGAINGYSRRVTNERLAAAGLPEETARPIRLSSENVATQAEHSGSVLGDFLPFLVIAQVVGLMTGIAIDLTAGEKERRTIEALVATPLSRREIVVGKWIVTALIGSFGTTITVVAALLAFRVTSSNVLGNVADLPAGAVGSLLVGGVATALLLASVQLTIGFFARSAQQAGAMISPLFFIVFIPLFLLADQSGTTIGAGMYAVPVLGPSMLARFGLAGTAATGALPVALLTSAAYAGVVLLLADRLFRSERALLRV